LNPALIIPELLMNKYIPNLMAEPFHLSMAYTEQIYQKTNLPRLQRTLKIWAKGGWDLPKNQSQLGYIIIVELLACFFAVLVLISFYLDFPSFSCAIFLLWY
jgi:hypothetical protein